MELPEAVVMPWLYVSWKLRQTRRSRLARTEPRGIPAGEDPDQTAREKTVQRLPGLRLHLVGLHWRRRPSRERVTLAVRPLHPPSVPAEEEEGKGAWGGDENAARVNRLTQEDAGADAGV